MDQKKINSSSSPYINNQAGMSQLQSSQRNLHNKTVSDLNRLEDLSQKFDFPLNPAFFHSSVVKQPKKLSTLEAYCQDKDIAMTKQQSV